MTGHTKIANPVRTSFGQWSSNFWDTMLEQRYLKTKKIKRKTDYRYQKSNKKENGAIKEKVEKSTVYGISGLMTRRFCIQPLRTMVSSKNFMISFSSNYGLSSNWFTIRTFFAPFAFFFWNIYCLLDFLHFKFTSYCK